MPTLLLGGKERTLRFDLGEWEAVETQGITLEELLDQFQAGKTLSFKAVRILVWAMLSSDGVTVDDVRRWVTGENFIAVMRAVGDVLRETFPKEAAPKAGDPTGSRSPSVSPESGNGSTPTAFVPESIGAGRSATGSRG